MIKLNMSNWDKNEVATLVENFKRLEIRMKELYGNCSAIIEGKVGEFYYIIKNEDIYFGELGATPFLMRDIYGYKDNVYRPYDFMFNILKYAYEILDDEKDKILTYGDTFIYVMGLSF